MANLTRYGLFDDMFGDLGKGFWLKPVTTPSGQELQIKLDVKEDEKAYKIDAEIPGVKKEDIQVDVVGNQISIRAEVKHEKEEKKDEKVVHSERYYGAVARSLQLPVDVDAEKASASYKDGVLNLMLPKKSGAGTSRVSIR